jgi:hypothetical protein
MNQGEKAFGNKNTAIACIARGIEPQSHPFARAVCLQPLTTPPQVPTWNPNHIKQKTRIANGKSKSTSACYIV